MGKNDKKSGDKAGAKGKGSEGKEAGGKAKGAMSINVRHILVCPKFLQIPLFDGSMPLFASLVISYFFFLSFKCLYTNAKKCEKHSKKEEALAKLSEGVKFDEVARTYSEDKARQGT